MRREYPAEKNSIREENIQQRRISLEKNPNKEELIHSRRAYPLKKDVSLEKSTYTWRMIPLEKGLYLNDYVNEQRKSILEWLCLRTKNVYTWMIMSTKEECVYSKNYYSEPLKTTIRYFK